MKVSSLDLNLLTALTALLEERHVSRAARRIGLSQSAMSEALGRLRRHFGDDLLLRVGNRYELTPFAAGLRPTAAAAVDLVDRTFAAGARFDPATCEREFVLLSSDYATSVFGPRLIAAITAAAPRARVRLVPLPRPAPGSTTADARAIDGFLMPRGMATPGFAGAELFRDTWVCLVSADNERVAEALTVEAMADAPWVVQDVMEHSNPVLSAVRARGAEPRLECVVGEVHSIPFLVRDSSRIGVVPARLTPFCACLPGVRVVPVPFETPPVIETLWWHKAHTADPAHRWLRETAVAAGTSL